MRVIMPILYETKGVRKGERIVKEHRLARTAHFEIAEASSFEAPVAIENVGGARSTGHVLWHDGRTFMPDGYQKVPAPVTDPEQWSDSLLKHSHSISFEEHLHSLGWGRAVKEPDFMEKATAEMRTVEHDGYEEALRTVEGIAAGLLVVDGRMYREVDTPLLYICDGWVGHCLGLGELAGWTKSQQPTEVYTMDRFEDAEAQARGIYRIDKPIQQPEVIIPEACRFDDEGASIGLAARRCISPFVDHLNCLNDSQGIAFFRLRSALSSGDPFLIEQGLRVFADECGHTSGIGRNIAYVLGNVQTIARRAIDRWEMRPMDFTDAHVPGM